jgi:FAD dependent oxidoreductase TIGR03364
MAVLAEFAQSAKMEEHRANLVAASDLGRYCQALRENRILGGLFSEQTWKVDQRQASGKIASWLKQKYDVSFYFSTDVQVVSSPHIATSAGSFTADHIILCNGDEFASLFPDAFAESGVTSCQLQMMRTHPQPSDWRLQPFVMGGLSMSHYSAFASCASLQDLVTMQAARFKPYIDDGIHVIITQEPDGSVTLGDSHAYGNGHDLPRSVEIDALILKEAAEMVALAESRIAERWLGHYAYLPNAGSLVLSPKDGVTAVSQTNGQGMTHGFSIAEEVIADIVQ